MVKTFFLAILVFIPKLALADWYVLGAAYECSKNPQRLTIEATNDSSNDWLITPKPKGFTDFVNENTVVNCGVGSLKLKVAVRLVGPAERGECAGIGNVDVQIFGISRKPPIFEDSSFGNDCSAKDPVVSVEITGPKGNEKLTICKATRATGDKKERKCETTRVSR